jgi:hypothetical protein
MPHERSDWHGRIKGVEREYRATHLALGRLEKDARLDPGILGIDKELTARSLLDTIENAEGTYLIRMFAGFENALRSYWPTIRRPTVPPMRALVDSIGSHHRASNDLLEGVHRVRKYRNKLVHESEADAGLVPIAEARGYLNRFLRRLPEEWG